MSFQLLLALVALAAFTGLAAFRLYRVRAHRDTLTGGQQAAFVAAFLILPPLVLQLLLAPKGVDGVSAVILYVGIVAGVFVLEWVVALIAARFAPVDRRQMLLMALIGRDTSGFVPFDPPMTAELSSDVDAVERANSAFPRGTSFMGQTAREDFQANWDALDAATRALEERISAQRRLRLGVSERALDLAADARGRLDTLRRESSRVGEAGFGEPARAG